MPTAIFTPDSRSERREGLWPSGSPRAVLARFPRLTSELEAGRDVEAVSRPPGLTHFEYLMGDFGLYGEAAPTPAKKANPATPVALPNPKVSVVTESATRLGVAIAPPSRDDRKRSRDDRKRRGPDWAEMILRLDAAIEPYSRAIVLLVLVAVAAFTLLLLRVSPDKAPARAPLVPAQPLATSPQPEPKLAPKADNREAEKQTPVALAPEPPTAHGPATILPLIPLPTLATLGEKIMPALPEAVAEGPDYPSTKLPPIAKDPPPLESIGRLPVEARLRNSVMPIQSYK